MNEQQGVRPTERMTYRDSTYSIVSKVAYLIGVPKRIFENQHEPPQLEIFQQLENDKNARIIRHLCIIRTAIERNFKYINDKMRTEYKTILSLSQFVPADSISQLSADNVNILIERIKQNKSLVDIRLTARACQEYYENNVDSFIIVSSDSDYWGLISSLPKAQFLVMIEHNKCGPDMKAALANSGIFYCYLHIKYRKS